MPPRAPPCRFPHVEPGSTQLSVPKQLAPARARAEAAAERVRAEGAERRDGEDPSTGTSARQPEPPDVVVILDPPGPEEVEAMAQRLAALLLGGALTPPEGWAPHDAKRPRAAETAGVRSTKGTAIAAPFRSAARAKRSKATP
jgi:hypothetical protein